MKKGIAVFPIVIVSAVISMILTLGIKETKDNGVLKANGKKIWCKMMNRGNDICNNL